MKFKYLLIALFSLVTATIFAQNGKLAGVVKEESGQPLISANVVIDANKGWGAVTDFDGNYEIANLPAGTYDVTFRYLGKEDQVLKVTIAAGETKKLNVTLREKQTLINTVVVTGSKYEKKASEETVSLEVMKGSVMSNQNVTDVSNGVQKVPGVTIADGQANIRGGSGWSYGAGSRVAVLYDDMLITTADADDAKWSMIPVENIDQIEVLKGAASAIYGTGALNGVINARMAYPTDEPYTRLQTYAGFYDGPKTRSMKWWQGQPRWFAGFNFADRRKVGQWDITTGTAYNNDRSYLDSADSQDFRVNAKIRYRFKKIQGLNVGINLLGYWSWGKTFFLWDSTGTKSYRPLVNTVTIYDNGRYLIDPFINYSDSMGNRISLRYRWLNSSNVNSTGQGSIAQRNIIDLSYQRSFDVSKKVKINFIAGVGGKIDRIAPPKNPNDPTPDSVRQQLTDSLGYYPIPYLFGDVRHDSYNASVYAQVDGKFFDRLNVSLGARWEYFNVDGRNSLKDLTYPLFRLGLNYQAAEASYIRASFGQGFRYPSIAELYVTTKLGAIEIFPNKNLKPETGYSAEIGFKQGFQIAKKSSAPTVGYFDIAGFWNQYQNMMEFMFGTFGDPSKGLGAGFSSQNIGTTRILGLDVALGARTEYKNVEFNFLVGYTFINSKALNWDKPLTLYNVVGDTMKPNPGGLLGPFINQAYNNANAPAGLDTTTYITYGMLSSSSNNTLKYRPTHQLKLLFNIIHKRFEFNLDYQFIGYQQNIDYAFVSPFFAKTVAGIYGIKSFAALRNYRNEKEAAHYRGDNIVNIAIAYKPVDAFKLAFIIKNVANWEWMPRPGRFEAPRSYTLQLTYNFSHLAKNKHVSE